MMCDRIAEQCAERVDESPQCGWHDLSSLRATTDLRSIVGKMLHADLNERYASRDVSCVKTCGGISKIAHSCSQRIGLRSACTQVAQATSAYWFGIDVGMFALACVAVVVAVTWSERIRLRSRVASDRIAMFNAAAPQVYVAAVIVRVP